ncbi:MAG: ATP-binding protein [Desulfarculaceae bacterium]|jgi:PAS domain S-box-containing protein
MTKAGQKPQTKNTVQQIALELDKYRQIVETAHDAVVTINQNHEIVYMNQAAEAMFGYKREELLGGDLSPLIPSEHRQNHRNYVERFVRTRQARLLGHVAEVEAERRDGSRFPVSISFNLTESEDGLLFTAIMRDLSAEKNLANQVKNAEALAAVGQMVATVSHEIKTPLALIGGFAAQLKRQPGLNEKSRHKLDIITQEVARLEAMLSDLNDLSRPQRYNWEEFDLCDLINQVREFMGPRLRKGKLSLKVDCSPEVPPVVADRNRLKQVVINLVNNAVQASSDLAEVKMILSSDEGEWVTLEVRDCGCGIESDHLKQLFTPFFTTKKQGTGLGLPVARRIVEDHGGNIEVESELNQGTTVRVKLPPAPGINLKPAPRG